MNDAPCTTSLRYICGHRKNVCKPSCLPGTYLELQAGCTILTSCPCVACPVGKYTDQERQENVASCKDKTVTSCPPGQGLNGGSATADDASCPACIAGQYSVAPDASSCVDHSTTSCTAGMGFTAGTATANDARCDVCTAGQFSAADDQNKCIPHTITACGAGEGFIVGTTTADGQCIPCAAGRFSAAVSSAEPCGPHSTPSCTAGTERLVAGTATSDAFCTRCAEGTYLDKTKCKPDCSAGTYLDLYAGGTGHWHGCSEFTDCKCESCLAGKYTDQSRQESAVSGVTVSDQSPCTGYTTTMCIAGEGLTAGTTTADGKCNACGPGQFSEANDNKPCAPMTTTSCVAGEGFTAGTTTADATCGACGPGTFSAADDSQPCVTTVTGCIAGKGFTAGTTTADATCEACGPNTFSEIAWSVGQCVPHSRPTCASGERSVAGTATSDAVCSKCAVGEYLAPSPTNACTIHTTRTCLAGEMLVAGTAAKDSECVDCPLGRYRTVSQSVNQCYPLSKTPCSAGRGFVAGTNSTDDACADCQNGRFAAQRADSPKGAGFGACEVHTVVICPSPARPVCRWRGCRDKSEENCKAPEVWSGKRDTTGCSIGNGFDKAECCQYGNQALRPGNATHDAACITQPPRSPAPAPPSALTPSPRPPCSPMPRDAPIAPTYPAAEEWGVSANSAVILSALLVPLAAVLAGGDGVAAASVLDMGIHHQQELSLLQYLPMINDCSAFSRMTGSFSWTNLRIPAPWSTFSTSSSTEGGGGGGNVSRRNITSMCAARHRPHTARYPS